MKPAMTFSDFPASPFCLLDPKPARLSILSIAFVEKAVMSPVQRMPATRVLRIFCSWPLPG